MDNDFEGISWQHETENTASRSNSAVQNEDVESRAGRAGLKGKRRTSSNTHQAGRNADAVDLAGIGDGRLDCTVGSPLKESDGTKDAFVSYLITTHVSASSLSCSRYISGR